MDVLDFMWLLKDLDVSFFTGVPDSKLKALCDHLMDTYGISGQHHVIATHEGTAVALAAGKYLASGKVPCVYLQNSGLGNIINPVASLLSDEVYGIPCIFVVGWRGEPGLRDEPQHRFQGKVTLELLQAMDIEVVLIEKTTTFEMLKERMDSLRQRLLQGKSVAFVVKSDGLIYDRKMPYHNDYSIPREQIIEWITQVSQEDIIVSTTGKTSRELFEIRVKNQRGHGQDFLTVGSMGHSSSIALGIALEKPNTRVWCIDGDGAMLMHMGAAALIGANAPKNLIHIMINNNAHESVGGQPTIAEKVDFVKIAQGCSYAKVYQAVEEHQMKEILARAQKEDGPIFIEFKSAIGSRKDLGRPTTSAAENKEEFMNYLKGCH